MVPPYLHYTLFVIQELALFIPLFYIAALLKVEKKWIQISYYVLICLYLISLIVGFLPFELNDMIMANTTVGAFINLTIIYISIIFFLIKNVVLSPLFKIYACLLIITLIYDYGVNLIVPYFNPYSLVLRFTSLIIILPIVGEFYVIYFSKRIMPLIDV